MSEKPPIFTFFNNKRGVGKTSLIYHLAWMYAGLHKRVLAVDLDPQCNLTAAFLDEDTIDQIWESPDAGGTLFKCIKPLTDGGEIAEPVLRKIANDLYLVPGDIDLSGFEDTLYSEWRNSMDNENLYSPMRILSSFWEAMQMGAKQIEAEIILVDIGSNLGVINRTVLVATDHVIIPLGTDLISLQGLKVLGPTLRRWKTFWKVRLEDWSESPDASDHPHMVLPKGQMQPIGYVCQQHKLILERPIRAHQKWVNRIPDVYRTHVLDQQPTSHFNQMDDPECLATIRHYRNLMAMGQEHRKPIFKLTSADGAIGSHAIAVQGARTDFKVLATKIAERMGMDL